MRNEKEVRLERLDRLGELLDSSIRIPGIGYRIGYDAIIGLVPGIGDIAGLVMSSYIVLEASRFNLPKSTLLRMMANVAIEAVVGAIPLFGDVFDATYKANLRNLRLLHSRLEDSSRAPKEDKMFLATAAIIPLAVVLLLSALIVWVLTLVF